jgi:outer membrane receptor protein involved in Fe transport
MGPLRPGYDRGTVLLAGAAAVGLACVVPAQAAGRAQRFDIPPQPAGPALREFARQAGLQVVFPYALVSRLRSPGLRGTYTPEEAAAVLAEGAGLTVTAIGSRILSFTLRPAPAPAAVARAPARRARPPAAFAPARVQPAPDSGFSLLEEVVVTANRQIDTINRIAIPVTVETQRSMDQKGVRYFSDLQNEAPSLQVTGPGGYALAHPTIRGIQGAGVGVAATTGVYLDDTPLQKRNPSGGSNQGYTLGTPIPPLFDLERVEILRGPQGTLFGSGSEGGTVRLITPTPSLDRVSRYLRTEVSTTRYGGPSYEAGAALGLPLARDRLAIRASLWARRTGGWIDLVDRYSGETRISNGNRAASRLGRITALWAPTGRARLTVTYFGSHEENRDVVSNTTLSTDKPVVEPTACYDTRTVTPEQPSAYPQPVGLGDAACAALTAAGQATFTRPGYSYGPFRLGPDDRIGLPNFPWFASTDISVASATLDYDFGPVRAKWISSYVHDASRQRGGSGVYTSYNRNANATYGDVLITRGLDYVSTCRSACLDAAHIDTRNRRYGVVEELRLSSRPGARVATWVAGLFYSLQRLHQEQYATITDEEGLSIFGLTTEQRFGVAPFRTPQGALDGYTYLNNRFRDAELAGFADATVHVTRRLDASAGVRLSRLASSFDQVTFGPAAAIAFPTVDNGGLTEGKTIDYPITPRISLQYSFGGRDLAYVTAAKGYRAGGANSPLPPGLCAPALAVYGLKPEDVPRTYRSDSVWNYEVGAKARLLHERVQLNASAYRVDWRDAQITGSLAPPCGIPFVVNSGAGRVEGFELEAQGALGRGLTASVAMAYNDARYLRNAVAIPAAADDPRSSAILSAVEGQKFGVSPFTLQLGARYSFALGAATGYVRADWSLALAARGTGLDSFGTSAYAPDHVSQDTQRTNLRIGVELGRVDVNLFVNNAFNSRSGQIVGGRTVCAGSATGGGPDCASFATYTPDLRLYPAYAPRQVGIQLAIRD